MIFIYLITLLFLSCENLFKAEIKGCVDKNACNYNDIATESDNSCSYPIDENYDCASNCIQIVDCQGVCGGIAEIDECGVCDGDNSSCSDCAGIPNGNLINDCLGICGGNAEIDECGVCNGNGPEEHFDCDGNCVVQLDCLGICGGIAEIDECSVCDGDNSSCSGCTNPIFFNYNSNAIIDDNSCYVSYINQIKPIFDNYCISCHGNAGGLNLESYTELMASNSVVIGDSLNSSLWYKVNNQSMPPSGSLTETQIHLIGFWIQNGAVNNQ